MNFLDYVAQVDRAMKAPVTGDIVNIELDSVTSVLATVVVINTPDAIPT